MAPLGEIILGLQASLGPETASVIVRQLVHVPGGLEWLADEPVRKALASALGGESSVPATALLAATGRSDLASLPDPWPASLARRRDELMAAEVPADEVSPDDVMVLAGELLRADRAGGPDGVARRMKDASIDWRAPLAVAWSSLSDSQGLAARLSGDELGPLLSALRANATEDQAASALASAAGARLVSVLHRLVDMGDPAFAAAVAAAADRYGPGASSDSLPPSSALRRHLQQALEDRRAELAALTDALATAADFDGDPVTAGEARQHALQLGPSSTRLANVAMSVIVKGDAAGALSLLPPSSVPPSLGLPAGLAYLKGGAIEKGRALLVESALSALETGVPTATAAMASGLLSAGELALALEVYRCVLSERPSDVPVVTGYAQTLVEAGDFEEALSQARLALALDSESTGAGVVQIEALRRLGRPQEALVAWKAAPAATQASLWTTAVECAIDLGDFAHVARLLAGAPEAVPVSDRHKVEARALAAQGKGDEAVALLENAAQGRPGDADSWTALARLHSDLGDEEAARGVLRRGAQMAPGSAPIHAALARSLRMQDRPSEALAEARQALLVGLRDPAANLEAGLALLALGRPAEAVEPLRTAYRRTPGDQETRLALAEAYGATGEIRAAKSLVAHLPEKAPAEAWMISGKLELMGDSAADPASGQRAAARLLRARALGIQDATLFLWLGRAYEAAGEPGRATEAFSHYLGSAPRDPDKTRFAELHRAECRLRAGDVLGAVRDLESLRATEGPSRRVLAPLARACLAASLFDEAGQAAEALLSKEPSDPDGLHVLAEVAQQTGEWGRSAQAFRTAAETAPADRRLWLSAAEASLKAGDRLTAASALERVASGETDPENERRRAQVLVGLGRAAEAIGILKAVAAEGPQDPAVWIEIADVSDAAGDRAGSVEALAHAADLCPWDVEVQKRLAGALSSAGRRADSIGAWRKALDLAPDDLRMQGSLARALMEDSQVEAGLNLFAEMLQRHPADPALLTEAGLATLRHGSATDAVELLQRAVDSGPSPESLAALGEARLRLNEPARAIEALSRAISFEGTTAKVWALHAEASVAMGDLAGAETSIIEARRPDNLGPDDRLALANAELRLNHWNDALTALAPSLSSGDAALGAALARTILRVLEARWLFGVAARAGRHAPAPDVPADSLLAWLESALAGPIGSGAEGRALSARWKLHSSADDDEALKALLDEAAATSPGGDTVEATAAVLIRRGRPSEALEILRRARSDVLGGSWRALLAGIAHLEAGSPSLARQAFTDGCADAGLRPVAQALLARAHLAQGYSESAIAALNSALSQWPDEPAWHAALAELYLADSDLDSALPHLQAAVELAPEEAAWRLAYARGLRDAGHVSEALGAFERLLPLLPSEAMVWHEAGELALAAREFDRAQTLFDHAASLAPSEPVHLVGKARAALSSGGLRDAQHYAEEALELGGERSDARQILAAVAARKGDADLAIEHLDRAAAGGGSAELRRTRAALLIGLGRAEQAAQELRGQLEKDPDDEEAWSSLAEALEALANYPASAQALEAALRLQPRSADLNVRLARVERKSGQLDRALDLLRHAETVDPLQPELALELGEVYEARRELDHALDAYCRSTEVNPTSPQAFRRAGHMFKTLKGYAEAEAMLQRAVDLDPGDTATLQQLAAVRALQLVHGGTYRMAVNP